MKTVELPPSAPALMESTRALGYSTAAAVADILDNSVAAGASSIELWYPPVENPYVAILDDGAGMSEAELHRAMQYGSRSPLDSRGPQDLGRYGLGMKTASLSQGRRLTVVTKQQGTIAARRWDLDEVQRKGTWALSVLEPEDLNEVPVIEQLQKLEHGTLVVWENLDRMLVGESSRQRALGASMDEVRDHLGLVFHRYLTGETGLSKLTISLNGEEVEAADPFLEEKSTKVMARESFLIDGSRIDVQPYTLPHDSRLSKADQRRLGITRELRKNQGFYVYRNKRLVIWGTWFRIKPSDELTKLARVRIDVPNDMDDLWTLDIKKSAAHPPAAVRDNLKTIVDKIRSQSTRTYTVRGRKQMDQGGAFPVWQREQQRDNEVHFVVNRAHPLITHLLKEYPETVPYVTEILHLIENCIPLHQLRVDLANDNLLVVNQKKAEAEDVENSVRKLLQKVPPELRGSLLRTLRTAEPFCEFGSIMDNLEGRL